MTSPGGLTRSESLTRRGFIGVGVGTAAGFAVGACGGGGSGGLGGGDRQAISVPTAETPWLDGYRKMIAKYERETGNKVNLKVFDFAGLLTQQTTAVQNKSLTFDLFQINEGWTGMFYDRGWVIPLRDVDSSFGWDPQVMSFDGVGGWDKDKRVTAEDGEPMAVPMNGNIQLYNYRRDLFDKLGTDPPTTWEDAVTVGRKAMSRDLVKYGAAVRGQADIGGYANTWDFGNLLASFGGDWFADPGNDWTPAVNDEHGEAAMDMWTRLAELGPKAPQSVGQAELFGLMAGGQLLQAQIVDAVAPQFDDTTKSKVANKVDFSPTPAGSVGHPTPLSGTWVLGIPPGLPAERRQAAYAFLQWITSKNTQMEWAKLGGVSVRKDVYAALADDSKNRWMKAVTDSVDHITAEIRYPFAADMLRVTERRISDIESGALSIKRGLDTMAREIGQVVSKAGFR